MYVFLSIIIKKFIFSMEATTTTTTTITTADSKMLDRWNSDHCSVLSFCKSMKTCDSPSSNPTKDYNAMTPLILLSTASKETKLIPTLENIPSELFIQYILPFVGRHQCCFVAAVHAKICYNEKKGQYHRPSILCHGAAREGNLTVLKYLVLYNLHGITGLVHLLLKMDICMYSKGVVKMDVNGIVILVQMQP
jgi:hypothetical protein